MATTQKSYQDDEDRAIERLFDRESLIKHIQTKTGTTSTTSTTFSTETSTSAQNQQNELKNKKREEKFNQSLGLLSNISASLNAGLKQQLQEQDLKTQQQRQKQEETRRSLELRLSQLIEEYRSYQSSYEMRRREFGESTELRLRLRGEADASKQQRESYLIQLKQENDIQFNDYVTRINALQEQLDKIKAQSKQERQLRKTLEQKIEKSESQRLQLGSKLNEISREVQRTGTLKHTAAEFERESLMKERYELKLQQLRELREQALSKKESMRINLHALSEQSSKYGSTSPSKNSDVKRQQMIQNLNDIKSNNKILFDKNLSLMSQFTTLQQQSSEYETKRLNWTEIANLLIDQNKFERKSRTTQVQIEAIEDQQRLQEDTRKEMINNLASIYADTEQNNEGLVRELEDYERNLQRSVDVKQELEDRIRDLFSKVCNKNPADLKIEQIDEDYDRLCKFQSNIDEVKKNQAQLQTTLEDIRRRYYAYEKQIKEKYHKESAFFITDNDSQITMILSTLKTILERALGLDQQLRSKAAHTEEQMVLLEQVKTMLSQVKSLQYNVRHDMDLEKIYLGDSKDHQDINRGLLEEALKEKKGLSSAQLNVIDFVIQRKDLFDQNERLKNVSGKDLKELLAMLDEIAKNMAKLDEALDSDKKAQCQKNLEDGFRMCEDIDFAIKELEERLKKLRAMAQKCDQEDKLDIIDDCDRTKNNIEKLKNQKDSFQKTLQNIQRSDNLVEQADKLKETVDGLQGLLDRDVKQIEREEDIIEEKLRKAIRKRKNMKRKECLDDVAKGELKLNELDNILKSIQDKIDAINADCTRLQNQYDYDDRERNTNIAEVRGMLKKEQDKLNDLFRERDEYKSELERIRTEVDNLENGHINIDQDIAAQWEAVGDKAKSLISRVIPSIERAHEVEEQVDAIRITLNEHQDKFRNKNQLYQDCGKKRQDKKQRFDDYQQILNETEKKLEQAKEAMAELVPVPSNPDFMRELDEKHRTYGQSLQKLQNERDQLKQFREKLAEMCKILDVLPQEVVQVRDLARLRDELDKFDMELKYQADIARNQANEADDLFGQTKRLHELNKQLKEKECADKLKEFTNDLAKADKLHRDATTKLADYYKQIEKALATEDPTVVQKVTILKNEANEIEKELQFIDNLKTNLRAQESQFKENLHKLQINPKQTTIKDYDNLSKGFGNIDEQSKNMVQDLIRINEDLDNRNIYIGDYMDSWNALKKMQEDFDNLMQNIDGNHGKLMDTIEKAELLASLIEAVLLEMEKGTESDYKQKIEFIQKMLRFLRQVQGRISDLKQISQEFEPRIEQLKTDRQQALDIEALSFVLREASNLNTQLLEYEEQANQCGSDLKQIQRDIGEADIPELVPLRDKEVGEFSNRLRKAEQEVDDLKKQLSVSQDLENYAQLEQDIQAIDSQLAEFRQYRTEFKRIMTQELSPIPSNIKVLQDLEFLRSTIQKIRELWEALQRMLDLINQLLMRVARLRRQIGSLDLMKRWRQLSAAENNQERRLDSLKTRLDRIAKGGNDCDGYTSNVDEATFVDTLIIEIPEMQEKEREAMAYCKKIRAMLEDVLNEMDEFNINEDDDSNNQRIINSLDKVEIEVNINERTVCFLERLCDRLEAHFIEMEVKLKIDRRLGELSNLYQVCGDYRTQLSEMHSTLTRDQGRVEKKMGAGGLEAVVVDDEGTTINLMDELYNLQNDIIQILSEVSELSESNNELIAFRDETDQEFIENVITVAPYKGQDRITIPQEVFILIAANSYYKSKILQMIRIVRNISQRMKDIRIRYQVVTDCVDKINKPKQLYKAVKGDPIDELFANFLNKINSPVPITRMANGKYQFGTKDVQAKIMNGRLVMRVGGGYMSIEEFMRKYGNKELIRMQTIKNKMAGVQDKNDTIFSSDKYGSSATTNIREDLDQMARQIEANYTAANKIAVVNETKKNISNIADMKRAMADQKSRFQTSNKSTHVSPKKVSADSAYVEKRLRNIEEKVGLRLQDVGQQSPSRAQISSRKQQSSPRTTEGGQSQVSSFVNKDSMIRGAQTQGSFQSSPSKGKVSVGAAGSTYVQKSPTKKSPTKRV